ncbi:hypothetical protein JMJ77_0006491 [Colletotrichum scovillei]|uniref:Uncharacterized protein n=1 Tax=Colletotrichum scovillei TaxID=1209932 RepID=A0A9P7UL69_9PEZI|nr:hypothetical protein JMJ77_0006491 [Colletotrichum scovillei]KAG7077730.1 hypothetical protein JMJ76_0014974 [Colletotrichum scovillei]KAG7084925.1 hypothetical protein JMJ78_0010355 [Colletotrichum scovillei]
MLPATFVALAAALAPVLAGPVAEPEGALKQLEARKVCGAGYLACHYRFGFGDKDQPRLQLPENCILQSEGRLPL